MNIKFHSWIRCISPLAVWLVSAMFGTMALPIDFINRSTPDSSDIQVVIGQASGRHIVSTAGKSRKSPDNLPDNMDSTDCAFSPIATDWSIRLDAMLGASPDSICTLINPLVGDLDGDGFPEIVCFSTRNYNNTAFQGNGNPGSRVKNVVVYDGRTQRRKAKFDLPSYVSAFEATPFGLAKPYNGDALMVFACTDNNLYAYKLNGSGGATQVWGPVSYGSGNDYATTVGFADFNNDSIPEVYVRNKIFNLTTGQLLLTVNSSNQGATYAHVGNSTAGGRKPLAASFASNVVGDSRCELLLGNEIHTIQITNPNGTAGNSATLYATAPLTVTSGISADGHVQVADFNLDGHLDLFFTCRPAQSNNGFVYGYVWDVFNNTVSTPIVQSVTLPGKSIPLIADIDNDDTVEVVLHCGVPGANVRAYKYHASTQSFSLFWTRGFNEDSYSNSLTLFDFNQDGNNELLICDNDQISIVNGSTPAQAQTALSTLAFREVTIMQYPIIADIDNDGAAEIVFVGKQNSQSYQGTLNICRSNADPWAPARPVWNQYMYNSTHVNMDLTIPAVLFDNATAFTDPDNGVVRRPFNNFLQQGTSLDYHGRPYYTAADLQPELDSVELTPSGIHVVFDVCNVGISTFTADTLFTQIYVDQYGGSPLACILAFGDAMLPLEILPDSCQRVDVTIPFSRICPYIPFDSLVFAVNDAGQGIAMGLTPECRIDNNLMSVFNEVVILRDTISDSVCRGAPYTRNGFNLPTDTTSIVGVHHILDTVPDPVYCQRIRLLHLTVLESFVTDTAVDACDSLFWNGTMHTSTGVYADTIPTAEGCDSIVNLHLTLHESWFPDTVEAEACDSLVWYDTTLTVSTILQRVFPTMWGCDSTVTLQLTLNNSVTFDTVAASCNEFEWTDGRTFDTSGDFSIDYTTVDGCDSIWLLHLTIHTDTIIDSLYEGCDSVVVGGLTYLHDTLWVDSLTTVFGCDSLLRTQIWVYSSTRDTVFDSIPIGAVYTFEGHEYTDSGTYTVPFFTAQGCDSLRVLELSVYDLCSVFLQFPNLVTPNGDGINDRFVVKGLVDEGCYPVNHLTIYNRWGARVYDAENITKTSEFWDPAADRAPAGTYFFIFRGKGHKGRVERRGAIEVIY